MNRKEVKAFAKLDAHVKTAAVVALYQTLLPSLMLQRFTIKDVEIGPDYSLTLNVAEGGNEEDTLHDFAAVVYALSTGNTDTVSMAWNAGRKIKEPVLREIVLTLCGRNALRPLLHKMRQPYVDEDHFFEGYTTVDEKDATAAYQRQRKIEEANRADEAYRQAQEAWKNSPEGKSHAAFMKSMEKRYDPLAPARKFGYWFLGACFVFGMIFSIVECSTRHEPTTPTVRIDYNIRKYHHPQPVKIPEPDLPKITVE